jgi:hypothetical protein
MLKIKLGKALAFLPKTNFNLNEAFDELFGKTDLSQLPISEELLSGLSNEWLLFDYKPPKGKTLIEQYYFNDPDNLSPTELKQLQQIIETQSINLFQPYSKSKPPYVFLQSIFSNRRIKVYDRKLSLTIDQLQGSFLGRLAKVDKINYLVGSNPIVFPIHYTQRAIKLFAKEKTPAPTLPEILQQLSEPPVPLAKVDKVNISLEQNKLEKKYLKLAKKFKSRVTFKQITDFIYEENYKHNFADYLTDLMKLGIPDEMCIKHINFFNEVWNYFPHKILGDKCPHQLYEETYLHDD